LKKLVIYDKWDKGFKMPPWRLTPSLDAEKVRKFILKNLAAAQKDEGDWTQDLPVVTVVRDVHI